MHSKISLVSVPWMTIPKSGQVVQKPVFQQETWGSQARLDPL